MKLALVGVGVVGCYIGKALIEAGHELVIHDVDPEAGGSLHDLGARTAASVAEATSLSEAMISTVPAPEDVMEITLGADGVLATAAPGYLHIMTSTIGTQAARELAESSKRAGQLFLDAPLSAGPLGDQGRMQLTVWAAGPIEGYIRARPVIEAFAPYCLFCGPAGDAQTVKLVNNLTTLALAKVLGETLTLGVKAGVPLELLRAGLTWGTAQNRLMDESFGLSVFSGDWRPGYRVDLAAKDMRLADALAESVDLKLSETAPLLELFDELIRRGWRDRSVHSMLRLAEEKAGVKLRLQQFTDREILPEG